MANKRLDIVAHMHAIKIAYLFGQADSRKEAEKMIKDFFGPNPDPRVVTVILEESKPNNEQAQS